MEKKIRELVGQYDPQAEIKGIELLPQSGSSRLYYRVNLGNACILAAYNENVAENLAYFSFTRQFLAKGLNVPGILARTEDNRLYLVEDLGNTTLFSLLPAGRTDSDTPGGNQFSHEGLTSLYEKVVDHLLRFQGVHDLDYSYVFPVEEFDSTSMEWDLNYFKYFFVRIAGFSFSEPALETDFKAISEFLNRKPHTHFMYRDFQSRNIMIKDGQPWFIDFQGGRKGPMAYDLVSLLYDAKANLDENLRDHLLGYYCQRAACLYPDFHESDFQKEFMVCQLLRILQAMGAYGLRGFVQKKSLFLKSVPYAIRNISQLLDRKDFPLDIPQIRSLVSQMKESPLSKFENEKPGSATLKIEVCSFSLRRGYPPCDPEHGGGFVFDCRFLPNPGRLPQYKELTGRSPEVIFYLEQQKEVGIFLQNTFEMLKPAVLNYIERGFSHLSIAFGCTGGQHRSVYCAEKMSKMLKESFQVEIHTTHLEHPE